MAGVLGGPVQAAEPSPVYTLDTLVVNGDHMTDTYQIGDVDRNLTPISCSVVDRDAFEGRLENVSDCIERAVGVQIRESGGIGSFSSMTLRGAAREQIRVYLDGILLNDASGGGVDLSRFSVSDVDALEIYRGMTPLNLGNAGIGGAVNIRTLRCDPGTGGGVSLGGGSFGTCRFSGLGNHRTGQGRYLVSIDALKSENDFPVENDNGTTWNTDDDRTEDRNNADVEQLNVLAKAGWKAPFSGKLDLAYQYFDKAQGLPARDNTPAANTRLDTRRHVATLQWSKEKGVYRNGNVRMRLNYIHKNECYDDSHGHIGLGIQKTDYRNRRYSGDCYAEWVSDRHALSLFFETVCETYDADESVVTKNVDLAAVENTRVQVMAGCQDAMIVDNGRWVVTPALRLTWLEDRIESGADRWGNPVADSTDVRLHPAPQIGVRWQMTPRVRIKANAGRFVREPSFFERFGDRGFFLGNPALDEEKGLNLDTGIHWNLPAMGCLHSLQAGVTGFYTDVSDLITRSYDSRGVGKSENVSEARIVGIETEGSVFLDTWLRVSGNLTWQDTQNRSAIGAFDGKQLAGQFRWSGMGRVEVLKAPVRWYAEYRYANGMYYDTANLLPAKARRELNTGLTIDRGRYAMQLDVTHVTDAAYEAFNGYPVPGRAFFVSIRYRFGETGPVGQSLL